MAVTVGGSVRRHLAAAAVLTLILLPVGGAQFANNGFGSYGPRQEKPDENYVIGYLTWKDGKGGIAWDESKPSDPAMTLVPTLEGNPNGYANAWVQRVKTTFTSDALPITMYLNVTHLVQVWVMDPNAAYGGVLEASLFLDDKFIGGSLEGMRDLGDNDAWAAPMHPEVDVLPKGGILRFEVYAPSSITNQKSGQFTIKFQGEDRSRILIPVFPAFDLPFRRPDVFGGAGSPQAGSEPSSFPALAAAAPLLLLLAGRNRRRAGGALLVALLLAGCAGAARKSDDEGPGPAGTGGTATATLLPDPGGGLTGDGNGTIVGTIIDDQRVPVAAAFVTLSKVQGSKTTDKTGRFSFRDMPPGAYEVRVDREEYRSYEGKVEVRAGHITTLEITMKPLVDRAAGFRPHDHNYWLGKDSATVFHGPIEYRPYSGVQAAQNGPIRGCQPGTINLYSPFLQGRRELCMMPFLLPEERDGGGLNLVNPGTRFLDVKVDWDPSQNTLDGVGIGMLANDQTWPYAPEFMMPKPRGATTRIPLTWEQTDVGHQQVSTEQFFLYVMADYNQIIREPFTVDIQIHRGPVIPLEPPHQDFWGPNESITVLQDESEIITPGTNCDTLPNPGLYWTPAHIVPPDTTWLEVTMTQAKPGTAGVAPDFTLRSWPAGKRPSTVGTDYTLMTKDASSTAARKVYHLPIKAEQADAFYAKSSGWRFIVDDQKEGSPCYGGYNQVDGSFELLLTVIAHRGPPPS